ncbi:3-oxoacyl-ACP reductase [Pseudoglutamicibacter cumminsii]|uniref:3-oxoacyl-ACP reductase n=1 Tax=Pseudoglutamicibacter cumminsii TaxID=156979 RepID=UPI00195ECF65|nr:3-oxoacyl-ACP reductase [Pseudoglutamicibacter cumminsii]MBM7796711.1 3-oxoacyl-[acyl-carrier protein] reductase [Pseudoglutamicibacter cumminsii]
MADQYMKFTQAGFGKFLSKKLGLPRPTTLRRYEEGAPLVPGTAVVVGLESQHDSAKRIADLLGTWGVNATPHPDSVRGDIGAIILCTEDINDPVELSHVAMTASPLVKKLARTGRVVALMRPADQAANVAQASARGAVVGMIRSLARELRWGSTGNGIVLDNAVDVDAPSVQAALRFLLSGRSAYVDGQFIEVSTTEGTLPENPEKPLDGKVAAVTGAARGIGAAIAKTLARDGARVIAIDMPGASESLTKVANEIKGTALQLDVTAADAGERIIEHARQLHGGLDIVIHNAGITRDKLLANMDEARWNSVMAVNLQSQLRMNKQFHDAGLDGLRVVTLASTSGIAGNRGQTNYAASKAGVISMVAAEAEKFAAHGGSINAVAPGFIETDMTAKIPLGPRVVGRLVMPSLQQGGLPVDVAEAISFLASDGAGGVNGQTLRVCGQSLIGA